jgi:stalled ribosome alternative rescue factor ArfA
LQWKFSFVRTWWENKGDPHVHVIKFENLVNKPKEKWNKIFNKLNLNISEQKVKNVLSKYTKEKMRERDNRKGKGDMSHYRKNKKGWKELFTKEHIKMFENINGNIVKDLGYK